jgi:hypothetical protein
MLGFRRYASVVLLLVIAVVHFYRVCRYQQTPWKGGGFGMFSTVDGPATRFITTHLQVGDKELAVNPPLGLRRHITAAISAPTDARLDDLADLFMFAEWKGVNGETLKVTGTRLEVWRFNFDSDSGDVTSLPMVGVRK